MLQHENEVIRYLPGLIRASLLSCLNKRTEYMQNHVGAL